MWENDVKKCGDLTGQQFGDMVVLYRDYCKEEILKKHSISWKCKCLLCGKEFNTTTERIFSRPTSKRKPTTCCQECAAKRAAINHRIDMVGRIFGNIEVVSFNEDKSTKNRKYWNCICHKCNTSFMQEGYKIRTGKGMCPHCALELRTEKAKKDINGQVYGKLTVLESYFDKKPYTVKCRCACGNEIILRRSDVLSGHTQSCGCLQIERASDSNTSDWTGEIIHNIKIIKKSHQNNKGVWIYDCQCPLCGKVFQEIPARISGGHTLSCGCLNISKPEYIINNILTNNNISYKYQYSFDDCKYKGLLKFDFVVFNIDGDAYKAIEYDGRQHYMPVDHLGGEKSFKMTQIRDNIKNKYCYNNNIELLRIPYTLPYRSLEKTILDFLQ